MTTDPRTPPTTRSQRRRSTPEGGQAPASPAQRHRAEKALRAERATYSVHRLFLRRVSGIPGTLIGETTLPPQKGLKKRVTNWNYWWQAQLLDALVDAGQRYLADGRTSEAERQIDQCHRLLRGIRIHNFGTFVNSFYDDMAWLVLAAQRLNSLSQAVLGRGSEPAQEVGRALYPQLKAAISDETGGGAYWSKAENFKNLPASGPISMALSRAGEHDSAFALTQWFRDRLWDPRQGYLDGIKLELQRDGSRKEVPEERAFSYNQGVAIGAHLEIQGGDLRHVEEIVRLVHEKFTVTHAEEGTEFRVLDTRGSGDGGLFAGILARYLTRAAMDHRIEPKTRHLARDLVVATAELLWAGRREFDPDLPLNEPGIDVTEIRGDSVALFSPDATRHSSETLGSGARVELSTQVQAWTILEAAYRLA
ncbi:glycoside hydrolase family 76 protein [uncultured Kocuria sp.]|uniref:glycoside hydrolase family 76 protein n=1 Tax=uncultured Kocuria sp. TaxID=259305 RepID=UPI0025958EEA|nr:glycoside hydrolase family 76 protein [uncultured Kocuria sp.]MCT1368426.1 glycoside hydrolase family 76 [Rothia sp. p3-SID1597]